MKKAEIERMKEYGYALYMQGETIDSIKQKTGVGSNTTVNRWIQDGGWKDIRAAFTITRPQLVNQILRAISTYLADNADKPIDADKLAKFASSIEKLDKKDSPVDAMNAFMRFGTWMMRRNVKLDLIKEISKLQDEFLKEYFSAGD